MSCISRLTMSVVEGATPPIVGGAPLMIRRGWALLLGAQPLLAGCGLKGSLTLPEKPGDVEIRPAPGAPATSAQPAPPAAEPAETAARPRRQPPEKSADRNRP